MGGTHKLVLCVFLPVVGTHRQTSLSVPPTVLCVLCGMVETHRQTSLSVPPRGVVGATCLTYEFVGGTRRHGNDRDDYYGNRSEAIRR